MPRPQTLKIRPKPTQEQKQLDAELGVNRYTRSKEYQAAMDELCMFVTIGKNPFDDSPDSLTQLEMFLEGNGGVAKVEAAINPFRTGEVIYGRSVERY
jgi:hypothetical protein